MSQRHRALIAGLVIGAQAFTACDGARPSLERDRLTPA